MPCRSQKASLRRRTSIASSSASSIRFSRTSGEIGTHSVHVEEGYVVVGDFVKQDDELDEVRVGLLPERFFALAEEVVQKSCDAVGQGVRVQIVVQGVIAVLGVQADFDVVFGPLIPSPEFRGPCGRSRL